MKKNIIKTIEHNQLPKEINVTPEMLIEELKQASLSADIEESLITIGEDLLSYTKNMDNILTTNGIGSLVQFDLQCKPQSEVIKPLHNLLLDNRWGLGDAMRLASEMIGQGYFSEKGKESTLSIPLSNQFAYTGSDIHFRLRLFRNEFGNLFVDLNMHLVASYDLHQDFEEDFCDDGKACVYVIKT